MSKEVMELALRSIRELVVDESDDAPALQGVRMRKQKAEKALREALAQPEQEPTYTSTQATNCAGCGERKHTPLRIDAMGGYVCLTCIDKKLGSLLGEFGYEQSEQEPVAWEQFYPDIGKPKFVAQPEQEPVAWFRKLFSPEIGEFFDYKDGAFARETDSEGWTPLYTTPPQRTWVGLTDEEVEKIIKSNMSLQMNLAGIRADIEAAQGIKDNNDL